MWATLYLSTGGLCISRNQVVLGFVHVWYAMQRKSNTEYSVFDFLCLAYQTHVQTLELTTTVS